MARRSASLAGTEREECVGLGDSGYEDGLPDEVRRQTTNRSVAATAESPIAGTTALSNPRKLDVSSVTDCPVR
jgi:hypothetical protein